LAKLLFRGQTAVCLHLPALPASRLSSHGQSAHPNSCPSPPLSELPALDTVATPRMKHEPHPKKKPLTAQTLSNERTQSCTSTWRLRGDYVAVTWTALPVHSLYIVCSSICARKPDNPPTRSTAALFDLRATKHQTAVTVRVTRPPLAKRKKQLAPRSMFI